MRKDEGRVHTLYFVSKVEIPRMKVGRRQTVETLINEKALLFAKFLRDERETWTPRIVIHLNFYGDFVCIESELMVWGFIESLSSKINLFE